MRKKRQRPHGQSARTVSTLVLSFVIIAGCSETVPLNADTRAAGQEQALKIVKVAKIVKQKIGDPLQRSADVLSSVQFDIVTRAGGDIDQILKTRGDVVQEGEVILKLSSADARIQRVRAVLAVETVQNSIRRTNERARKEVENSRRELNNSIQKLEQTLTDMTRNYNKMKNDYEAGIGTKAQLYQMEVQLRNTRMDLEQLKQRPVTQDMGDSLADMEIQLKNTQLSLQQVEQSLAFLEVKAPVSGIMTELPIEMGMTLGQGSKIGLIQKLDPIKIKAMLTEEESRRVSGKTELTYYLPGTTQKYKGRVSFLSKVIDPESKAYEINLDVPNKDMGLKPGMKVWLQLTEEQDQIVVTVPTYSIVKEGDDTFVFVLAEDTVEKRKVQLGRLNEPYQEVMSGVQEGEQVVITNLNQLQDKQKVQRAAVE